MNIRIVFGPQIKGALYLAEILHAFGICCATVEENALATADPATDLLILPQGSSAAGLESFLQAGGSAIAIRPGEDIVRMVGLSCTGEDEKPARLRLISPICLGARGEPLWTLGPRTLYKHDSPAGVLAYLFEPEDFHSERIGIAQYSVGAGSLAIFAYDPAACIMHLRQGFSERANYLPEGQSVPRSIHLHQPDAPQDTAWRPTADLHAVTFCEIAKNLLAARAPVPTLWHIPTGRPGIVIYTGDEDSAPQEDNLHEMENVESFGGRMSLYVIPDETSITRELIDDYTRRGHVISVHPNLVPTTGQSQTEQLARAEAQVLLFKEKFAQPVHTLRNHCTMWPGYLDIPELWERLGIGMDANCFATRYAQSPDWGPYVNVDSAVPLRFVREDGSLIDVFQQPTQINDDVTSHPEVGYSQKYSPELFEWIARRIMEDAARFFHAPICANFHPWSFATYSTQQGRAVMRLANELDVPIWSLDRWHDFWRARDTWHMSDSSWDGSRLRITLSGAPCEQLSITLPVTYAERSLSTLTLNNEQTQFETVNRFQRRVAQAVLPAGAEDVEIVAEYSATESSTEPSSNQ